MSQVEDEWPEVTTVEIPVPDDGMNQNCPDTEQLLKNETTVAAVFDEYRDRLQRIVNFRLDPRLLGRLDADDILQDVYLEVARRTPQFLLDATVPYFVWVRKIALQIVIDVHRTHLGAQMRSARLEVSLHGGSMSSPSLAARLVDSVTSPSQAAVRAEVVTRLREALDAMDPIDREVLVLRHLEELNNGEVAAVLDLTKSAASKRYVRALRRLRGIMSDDSNLGES